MTDDTVQVPREPTEEMIEAANKALWKQMHANDPGEHNDRPIILALYRAMLAAAPQSSEAPADPDCICKGNWREIIKECQHLIGKDFQDSQGKEYTFFGVIHSDDDYYYGMSGLSGLRLLSCVGNLDGHGFSPLPPAPEKEPK